MIETIVLPFNYLLIDCLFKKEEEKIENTQSYTILWWKAAVNVPTLKDNLKPKK